MFTQLQPQQSPAGPSLVPPSSREALLEWGRSLVSSNRAHNPTPTGRLGMASPSSNSNNNNTINYNNNASSISSPQQQPPNRPSMIGGVSVASQTAQIIASGGVPLAAPRVVAGGKQQQQQPTTISGGSSTRQQPLPQQQLPQSGMNPYSANINTNNNGVAMMNAMHSGSAANLSALSSRAGSGGTPVSHSLLMVQHEPSGMGDLQPPPSSSYPSNSNTKRGMVASGASSTVSQAQSLQSNPHQQHQTPSRTSAPSRAGDQIAAPDTPLHRLSMMADSEVLHSNLGAGASAGVHRSGSSASSSGPNPMNSGGTDSDAAGGYLNQPRLQNNVNNNNSNINSNNNSAPSLSTSRVQSATNLLANNASARKAVLEDHRTYISHLKTMLESNDDRFRTRERELMQILERLVEAEKGIAESISARTTAAAMNDAAVMRLDGGGGAGEPRIFDGTDASALEKDIEDARAEIAQWESEEALCGAAVAQLAASIAELEIEASDSIRIYLDSLRHVLKLGEVAGDEARHGVSAHTSSTLVGEATAANRARMYNAVAGNLDKAHMTSQRIKVGLASIEKLCAAARSQSGNNNEKNKNNDDDDDDGDDKNSTSMPIAGTSGGGGEENQKGRGGALMKMAADHHHNKSNKGKNDQSEESTVRVAGIEIFSSVAGPSAAMNDYLAQINEALTAAHQMREFVVDDLQGASEVCNGELRKTGAVVDDAHQALQELVAQVDRERDELAQLASQEEAIANERADVARQLRALEAAAADHRKKFAADQEAVSQSRKKVDQLQSRLGEVENRTASLKSKEAELGDEGDRANEKLKLAQAEELAANDVVSQLSQQLALVRGAHEAAKRRVDKAQDQLGDYQSELTSLEEEQSTLEGQIKQLRVAVRTARQQATEKQKSNADHERNVQGLSLEFETSLSAANAAERESSMAKERLERSKEELRILTVDENDLKAQIHAVNDALMVESVRPKPAGSVSGNQDQFTLSGRGAIASRSGSQQVVSGGDTTNNNNQNRLQSRRGSVVNIVDIPVSSSNNNNANDSGVRRSGSAAIATSLSEPDQLQPHHHQDHGQPQIQIGRHTSSDVSSHVSNTPRNTSQQHQKSFPVSPSHFLSGGDQPRSSSSFSSSANAVMSDGSKGFQFLSVSPERAPVVVSMDTRHYNRRHFPGAASERSRSSISPTSLRPHTQQQQQQHHHGMRTGSSATTSGTPISTLQLMMQQQKKQDRIASSNFQQPHQQQNREISPSSISDNNNNPNRSTSRLSRNDADEVLFQQPGFLYHNQQQQHQRSQQQQQASFASSSQPKSVSSLQQSTTTNNNSNSNNSNMNSVQARLDSILQRKQQRERQQNQLQEF